VLNALNHGYYKIIIGGYMATSYFNFGNCNINAQFYSSLRIPKSENIELVV